MTATPYAAPVLRQVRRARWTHCCDWLLAVVVLIGSIIWLMPAVLQAAYPHAQHPGRAFVGSVKDDLRSLDQDINGGHAWVVDRYSAGNARVSGEIEHRVREQMDRSAPGQVNLLSGR